MLSPFECRSGIWFKRDDLYRLASGVNGSKVRACEFLFERARRQGHTNIVSGAACVSPQHAIVATLARANKMGLTLVIGATTLDKAVSTHKSIQIAWRAGARFHEIKVGFNPAIQREVAKLAESSGAYHLRYGIALEADASEADARGFHEPVARQCANIMGVEDFVLPFGSGNTGVGVLWGLHRQPDPPKRVHLMAIGPDRLGWANDRLELLGVKGGIAGLNYEVEVHVLHQHFAKYGTTMRETRAGIEFHPNYEGKIIRYLKTRKPEFWERRNGKTGMWIVGGPLK